MSAKITCDSLPCIPLINKIPKAPKITAFVLGILAMATAAGLYFSGLSGSAIVASYYVGGSGVILVFLSFLTLVVHKCKPQQVFYQTASAAAPPYNTFHLNYRAGAGEPLACIPIKFADGNLMCTYHHYDPEATVGDLQQYLLDEGKGNFRFFAVGQRLVPEQKISNFIGRISFYVVQQQINK